MGLRAGVLELLALTFLSCLLASGSSLSQAETRVRALTVAAVVGVPVFGPSAANSQLGNAHSYDQLASVSVFAPEAEQLTTAGLRPIGGGASSIAQRIAGGHAFDKLVVDLGEYPEISTRQEFAGHIQDVMDNGANRHLRNGREAGYHEDSGTVVIHDPSSPNLGTAFRRWEDPWHHFNNILQ